MKKYYAVILAAVFTCIPQSDAMPVSHHASPASLDKSTYVLFQNSMNTNAKLWNGAVKLVHAPEYTPGSRYPGNPVDDHHYFEKCCYKVRETSYYALELLYRDAPGDRQRAAEALDAVLKNQYVTPGVPWYGTFKRTPEEPNPGEHAVMWQDYDPNWREFIGTTLQTILIEYPDRISSKMSKRLYESIDMAVQGEKDEGRLVPSYTNPALMYGILWDFAAVHDKRADWRKQSADWTESVYCLFKKYDSFTEYNSPTYYSVDIMALSLWREYGSSDHIRARGSEMEAILWKTIAAFYQPDLHNLSGPYDRSYGMDLETAGAGVVGLVHFARNENGAPIPEATRAFGTAFSCQMAILGTRIPASALRSLQIFEGEHFVRRQIADDRVATAWIGKHVIYGGESTGKTRDVGKNSQFHPVTLQWRTPSGEIGWVRVVWSPKIDAAADSHGLTISTTGTLRLRIHAKGLDQSKVNQGLWDLPGLRVTVAADAQGPFRVELPGPALFDPVMKEDDGIDVVYPGITGMRLDIHAASEN